jgi:hypothetical protein
LVAKEHVDVLDTISEDVAAPFDFVEEQLAL